MIEPTKCPDCGKMDVHDEPSDIPSDDMCWCHYNEGD